MYAKPEVPEKYFPLVTLTGELRFKELQDLKIRELRIEFVTTVKMEGQTEMVIKTSHESREFAETFERP